MQTATTSEANTVVRLMQRPLIADSLLALVVMGVSLCVLLSLAGSYNGEEVTTPGNLFEWFIFFGPGLMIPFRRLAPGAALLTGAVLQMVLWLTSLPDFYLATAVLLFSCAASGGDRGRRLSWVVSAGLTAFTMLGVTTGEAPLYAVPLVGLFSVAATALGATMAGRAAYTEAVEARVRDAERSRHSEQQRALTEERNRIARELHDVVAHGLSVIVVQAGAARRVIDRDPDGAASALVQIEETGRTALQEMRHVLSIVRTDPDESWRPAPGLAGLQELIDDFAKTGLEVSLVERTREPFSGPLPGTVDLTGYRVVQEALTNVLKHGGVGVRASVEIERRPDAVEITIVDNGRGAAAADRGGHGLRGMQERVDVFGGTFSAGPNPGGGFAVRVSLPLERVGQA